MLSSVTCQAQIPAVQSQFEPLIALSILQGGIFAPISIEDPAINLSARFFQNIGTQSVECMVRNNRNCLKTRARDWAKHIAT